MESPMTPDQSNAYSELVQIVIDHGPDAIAAAFTKLMNTAMLIERQQAIGVGPYQRFPGADERIAYANGTKQKALKTPVGVLTLDVPKTRAVPGREDDFTPFYPQALERGSRATRAVVATLAQMYVQGVSTRDVKKVMAELGLENVSSSQVSRAMATLDEELDRWRNRLLGDVPYLILDARYEKVRHNGVVIDVALLTAIGITPDGKRRVLGTSVALSEAEVHWRDFLDSLVSRGMRGVTYIASDDHAGLKAARKAVLPAVPWQRCQFHLSQNAIHHCPTQALRAEIGDWLRPIFNAKDRTEADQLLKDAVEHFLPDAPKLAQWLEDNVPESLTVFILPAEHRKKMRTTNGIERPIQQELKRRTRNVRVFPNTDSLTRLASAILVEIDDEWNTSTKRYITWQDNMTR
jgi:putative transposase